MGEIFTHLEFWFVYFGGTGVFVMFVYFKYAYYVR